MIEVRLKRNIITGNFDQPTEGLLCIMNICLVHAFFDLSLGVHFNCSEASHSLALELLANNLEDPW